MSEPLSGPEIQRAMDQLLWDRTDEMRRRMEEYDRTVYNPSVKALVAQCPHEDDHNWRSNGVGWSWTECRFCGKRMQEVSTWPEDDSVEDEKT